jgi:SAM-dependent methyltransferase
VVIDLGAGSGQAVLRRARAEPEALVIGLDAEASAMGHSSQRGRAPANAIFAVEAAERLPGMLAGRADLVSVALPWGSLLRALVEPRQDVLERIAALLKPYGELELLLTDEPADMAGYESAGLSLVERREAGVADVRRLSSAWGKRLGLGRRRPAMLLRFARPARTQEGGGLATSSLRSD